MRPAAVLTLVGKAAFGGLLLAASRARRPLLAAACPIARAPRESVVFIFVAGHERLSWSGQNADRAQSRRLSQNRYALLLKAARLAAFVSRYEA
jgi:hypothetical protein